MVGRTTLIVTLGFLALILRVPLAHGQSVDIAAAKKEGRWWSMEA